MIGERSLDHGHPIGELGHGTADLIEKSEKFGDGDGLIRAGLPQDVCAFALAGDHQALGDELPDGVPCGHDRDAVPRSEVGEGGELVTGLVCAGSDGLAEVVGDALVGRSGIGLVHVHGLTVLRELAEP